MNINNHINISDYEKKSINNHSVENYDEDTIKGLDSIFSKLEKTKKDIVFYRGDGAGNSSNKYISVTDDGTLANNVFKGDKDYILKVKVKKGSKLLNVKPFSESSFEDEYLLDKKGSIKILDKPPKRTKTLTGDYVNVVEAEYSPF